MARQPPDEGQQRRRAVIRDRVKFYLEYKWDGNQRRMADDLGVSQGLVSKIVNGQQGAGKDFLAALARQPGVSADWLDSGEGPPLTLPPKGTLPVALGVLPGPPLRYPHLLTGQRQPVAADLDRETRYWLDLQANSLLLRDATLALLPGDLLLMETDTAWTRRLDLIEGRLCGVRCRQGLPDPGYRLGKLYSDADGVVFDMLDGILRFALEVSSPPLPTLPPPPSPETRTRRTYDEDYPPRRRTIRPLHKEEQKAEARRQAQEQRRLEAASPTTTAVTAGRQEGGTFAIDDVVGVCVYLARPSPRVVATRTAPVGSGS